MRSRFALALMLAPAVLLHVACAEEEDGTAPGEDVYGMWEEAIEAEQIYLDIRPDSITSFVEDGECFAVTVLDVIDREGDVFTLDDDGSESIAIITRSGDDGLVVEVEGDEAFYEWADLDPEDLDTC